MLEKQLADAIKDINDPALGKFLTIMLELHQQSVLKIDAVTSGTREIQESNQHLQSALDKILDGFPQGDPQGHRRYHEAVIAREEFKNELIKAAVKKAVESGFLVGGGYLLYAFWVYFKAQVMK